MSARRRSSRKASSAPSPSLSDRFEKQLPGAMFSRYGCPPEWETRAWAVYFTPKAWRQIIPQLKALEESQDAQQQILESVRKEIRGTRINETGR